MVTCFCSKCRKTFDISAVPAWDSPCPNCHEVYTWWVLPDFEMSEPIMEDIHT